MMSQYYCKVIYVFLVDSFDSNIEDEIFACERVDIIDGEFFAIDIDDLYLAIHSLEFVTFLITTAIRLAR